MTFDSIKKELQSRQDYNHILFNGDNATQGDVVVLFEDGAITGAYNTVNNFRSTVRAGFSLDHEVAQTSRDQGALNIKLADNPGLLTDWKENYVISILADLSRRGFSGVSDTNEPIRNEEKATAIEPVSLDDVEYSVNEELKALNAAHEQLGIDDYSKVTVRLLNDFIPASDEQNFIRLATSTSKDISSLLGFSSGFLISKILESSILLARNGSIEYAVLNDDGTVGDKVTLGFEKTRSDNEDKDSLSKYVDDHLDDGSDAILANDISKEGLTFDSYDADEKSAPVPDVSIDSDEDKTEDSIPMIDLPSVSPEDESSDTDDEEESTPTLPLIPQDSEDDSDDVLKPVSLHVPDLSILSKPEDQYEDYDQVDDTETEPDEEQDEVPDMTSDEEQDTTSDGDSDAATEAPADDPYANEDDSEVVSMLNEAEREDDVDNLVSVVERARHKLDELKTRKDEVDSELNDLPIDEAEKIDKEIASLKQDRSEIDDKITALRAQKSDIDDQVNDAKTRRAAVEDKLSHKGELEHEQSDLAEKIESLESVL